MCVCVSSPDQARLCELEDQAKASKKGQWSEGSGANTVRDLKYTIENPRNFVDSLHQKPINGNQRGGCGDAVFSTWPLRPRPPLPPHTRSTLAVMGRALHFQAAAVKAETQLISLLFN